MYEIDNINIRMFCHMKISNYHESVSNQKFTRKIEHQSRPTLLVFAY